MKRIWHTICNQVFDPVKWRRLNGYLVLFWMGMFAISIAFNLLSIVAYISLLSIYANWATHLGVWAASRAEAKQVEIANTERVAVSHAREVEVDDADGVYKPGCNCNCSK